MKDTETTSALVRHAKEELQRAGLFDTTGDYRGAIGVSVMELVLVLAKQEHSGFSAEYTLAIFDRVARFKPLTLITSEPSEWMEVTKGLWQSRRQYSLFSKNGGVTWYDIDDRKTWPYAMRLKKWFFERWWALRHIGK